MNDTRHSLRQPAIVALAGLLVLLVGAVLYYRERILFADSAYQFFNIVNDKRLGVYHYRFGAFVAQVFPWAGQQAHWPLHSLLIGYAASPYLFFILVISVIIFAFREYKIAILMALYYFLLVSDSYFLGVEEVSQGAAWMFLFFGLVLYAGRTRKKLVSIIAPFTLLAFLALSAHFILIIPFAFLWVYLIVERDNWSFSRRQTTIMSALLISLVGVKMLIGATEAYDNTHLHGITHISPIDLVDAFATPVVQMFASRCVTNYWIAILVFILGLISLFRAKQKQPLTWTIISFIGYLMLMGITYKDCDKNTLLFHIELEWKSLAMILATPFVFTVLPSISTYRAALLLTIVFAVRLGYIGATIPAFAARQEFNKEIVTKMKEKNIRKLAIYYNDALKKKFMLEWAIPYETIMETALQGDLPQYTFFIVNRDDKKTLEAIKDPRALYLFDVTYTDKLNRDYFTVDSTQGYSVMTYEDLFK